MSAGKKNQRCENFFLICAKIPGHAFISLVLSVQFLLVLLKSMSPAQSILSSGYAGTAEELDKESISTATSYMVKFYVQLHCDLDNKEIHTEEHHMTMHSDGLCSCLGSITWAAIYGDGESSTQRTQCPQHLDSPPQNDCVLQPSQSPTRLQLFHIPGEHQQSCSLSSHLPTCLAQFTDLGKPVKRRGHSPAHSLLLG